MAASIGYPVLVRHYVLGGRAMMIVYDEASLQATDERGRGLAREAGPRRPLPRRRLRGRRRRPGRRRELRHRRHPGAHRGGGHPLGRLLLRPPALHGQARAPRHHAALHAAARAGARGARADEHPVRDQRRHRLRARGQPTGLADGAVRLEGYGGAAGEDRGARHDRAEAGGVQPAGGADGGQLFLSRRRSSPSSSSRGWTGARAGDALDGRGHGDGRRVGAAFAKAQLGAGARLPLTGTAFVSVNDGDKQNAVRVARRLHELGFKIVATRGTASYLDESGVPCERIYKVNEGRRTWST